MDRCKIAVLGDGGVGKTALAVQFTLSCFLGQKRRYLQLLETYDPTIEDAFLKQMVVGGRMCAIEIIDTAGQEEYSVLRNQWIRGAEAFVVVYSIASEDSFNCVEKFWKLIHEVKKEPPPFILVGNMADKTSQREVLAAQGAALARLYGCELVETSAKSGQNVELPFTAMVSEVRRRRPQVADTSIDGNHSGCGRCIVM
ncbi:Ras-related protein Rab-26 [Paramarasmius palmivorus]|uniref:Ras-related protein Rab-26 n=1 Tax=Paramarasmius palmivorus TaxID=297713 RepID=A0AAW0ATX3_9AGAR